jgi:hypothetical protein
MKILKFFLPTMLALSISMTCSKDDTSGQKQGDSHKRDLPKSKLTGEWVAPDQENSYIYAFTDNDTIYIKNWEDDTVNRWPYQTIAEDSIQITRNWTTYNKVVFYSNDSIWISDFIPSVAAVHPPIFGDAVLKRRLNGEEVETICKWEQVPSVAPTNEQKSRLDNVFSDSNELLRGIQNDTLFAINNQKDMGKLQSSEYLDIWIDWDNYSIIGGKIVTLSVSDEILSQQLSKRLGTSSYKYEIEVKKCTVCYWAIGHHYFWTIYDKKLDFKDVSLTIKTVE